MKDRNGGEGSVSSRDISKATLSRRAALGLIGAGVLAGPAPALAETRNILGTWPLGVQLWTLNAQLQKDLPGTLKQLKATGYDMVETAGLFGRSGAEFRKLLDDNGLTCRSAHAAMGLLEADLDKQIEAAKALGARWLVCASPKPLVPIAMTGDWVKAMRESMTVEAWKANADTLAKMAPKVSAAGLKLAYHNHFMEFADHGGVTGYEILTRGVDAEHLRLEIDLGWVKVGGADPLTVLKRYAGRVDMLHIKDFVPDASQAIGYRCVEIGQGIIDWPPILKAARAQKVSHIFVEQEAPYVKPIFTSLEMTRDYLRKL